MAELAIAVGGAFLSSLLKVAIDRISKSSVFINYFKGKQVIIFDEEVLERLHITLYKISDVLEDAQVKEGAEAVRRWLGKVRAEVNHADDLLDEFNTECKRLQLLEDGILGQFLHKQTKPDLKVHRFRFPFRKPKNNPSYAEATLFIEELMPNLEKVTTRLEDFEKQIQRLGLKKLDDLKNFPHREPSTSVVDKSQFFGRDDEKEKMIERVLSDGGVSDVSVIAITGMGGIGKTTLAQLVYNDDRVKNKFQTRAWVCVSEDYDASKVTNALLMEVNCAVVHEKDNFNSLQVKLRDNLAGKIFLIILDDMWNDDSYDWSSLKTPLSYGNGGSKIIVTTRNEKVARMMQTEHFHQLKPMLEDQSWCLFKKQAFDNGDHTHEFERIGKKIVNKCKGLPLAIKLIAGALRPQRDINVWQDFLSSDDWAVIGNILPALWLSYKHLPPHLKGCFAFCALFHKDVPLDKDEVVLLWMANDLVKPSTQKKVGHVYFEELRSRSFFESVDEKVYLMHDLINDLARSLAKNICIRLEDYQVADRHQSIQQENLLPSELLHLSYLTNSPSETSKKFQGLAQVAGLRTFLPIYDNQYSWFSYRSTFSFSDMFPRFQRLRALNLSRHDILMVLDSIGDLKHLRFLNLASTEIKNLPKAICKCLNLQTLILANCEKLVELPEEMRLLINLQYLDVRHIRYPFIKNMATWFNIVKDTQNISIVVDTILSSVLEHLDKLQPCHSFNIIGLGDTDVVLTEGAKREELKDKSCIENLTLEWTRNAECSDDELNKFSKLEPHTNIKKLTINRYTGTRFPHWLGDSAFSNLESLSIESCNNCLSLPPLGQLTGLKKIKISGMAGITKIGEEFYGDTSTSKPFQALEYLEFSDMAEWAIWNTHSDLDFSSLKSFSITDCPKLVSDLPCGDSSEPIPLFSLSKLEKVQIDNWAGLNLLNGYHQTLTSLQSLEIHHCNNILSFPEGGLAAPNLRWLVVVKCEKMKSLPARMHTQLPLLTYFEIQNCPEIECFPEGVLPSSLETLEITNCSKMRNCQTNWGLQTLPSLKKVRLSGFEDTLFPEEGLFPITLQTLRIKDFSNLGSLNEKSLRHLSSLQTLSIAFCRNLKCLPQQKFSSSLSEMHITHCPLVESFPEGLASSLSYLYIDNCRKLAVRIEREKGEDWPNVSHIPKIMIDWERI